MATAQEVLNTASALGWIDAEPLPGCVFCGKPTSGGFDMCGTAACIGAGNARMGQSGVNHTGGTVVQTADGGFYTR